MMSILGRCPVCGRDRDKSLCRCLVLHEDVTKNFNKYQKSKPMKLHEVLEQVKDGEWFRPVGWKGIKMAFVIKGYSIYRVPSSRGGEYGFMSDVEDLKGNWEIVTADQVLDGE